MDIPFIVLVSNTYMYCNHLSLMSYKRITHQKKQFMEDRPETNFSHTT